MESSDSSRSWKQFWFGTTPSSYCFTFALFVRLIAGIYLIAFASLWTQIDGLCGEDGILPTKDYLEAVDSFFKEKRPTDSAVWNVPTLAWIRSDGRSLEILCLLGVVIALLVMAGILPLPGLALLWLLYLSLLHAGQVFLRFQWDILLLEAGFLTTLLAPLTLRYSLSSNYQPPRLGIWLVWLLLFRLMFHSGIVKLTWNDAFPGPDGKPMANAWETLTALYYHYWTQPLPGWTSWYVAKFPDWFHKFSVIGLFAIELVCPWLIFGPRRVRQIACASFVFLMLLIAGTGNYTFFNLLTIVLSLTLLDDASWPRWLRRRSEISPAPPARFRFGLIVLFAAFSAFQISNQFQQAMNPRARVAGLFSKFGMPQLHLVNSYGLFRQMTETRPELVIEYSADGERWQPVEFHWKPGQLDRKPRFCAPHQPRLDWQMWFEALRWERNLALTGRVSLSEASPWFQRFIMRLLEGEPDVLRLVRSTPAGRPEYLRVVLYQYRFSNNQESKDGSWWHRDQVTTSETVRPK